MGGGDADRSAIYQDGPGFDRDAPAGLGSVGGAGMTREQEERWEQDRRDREMLREACYQVWEMSDPEP